MNLHVEKLFSPEEYITIGKYLDGWDTVVYKCHKTMVHWGREGRIDEHCLGIEGKG